MPTYTYRCPVNHTHDRVRPVDDRAKPSDCPVCGKPADRDVIASMPAHTTEQEYAQPIFSEALGVHPNQVAEAQKRFPHHEFHPDGRLILRSHAQRQRVLKELGFRDWNSYT